MEEKKLPKQKLPSHTPHAITVVAAAAVVARADVAIDVRVQGVRVAAIVHNRRPIAAVAANAVQRTVPAAGKGSLDWSIPDIWVFHFIRATIPTILGN